MFFSLLVYSTQFVCLFVLSVVFILSLCLCLSFFAAHSIRLFVFLLVVSSLCRSQHLILVLFSCLSSCGI